MADSKKGVEQEITEWLGRPQTIPAQKMRQWMRSTTPSAQEAVFGLLDGHYQRIEPLSPDEIDAFCLRYFESWLLAGASGGFSEGRYIAAHSLQRWFMQLWKASHREERVLEQIRALLARLARELPEVRDVIVTGILEHLFKDAAIIEFFSSWNQDSLLASLVEEALQLAGA